MKWRAFRMSVLRVSLWISANVFGSLRSLKLCEPFPAKNAWILKGSSDLFDLGLCAATHVGYSKQAFAQSMNEFFMPLVFQNRFCCHLQIGCRRQSAKVHNKLHEKFHSTNARITFLKNQVLNDGFN